MNAGHGTSGGSSVKTQCHPDGTPKVTGGTTGRRSHKCSGSVRRNAVCRRHSGGKGDSCHGKGAEGKLLARGYELLMIREGDDVQLDNIARTVIAN